MLKILISLTLLLSASAAFSSQPNSCRLQAAKIVVEELNQQGRLWETRQAQNGEVEILVEGGKIWLDLADEEVYRCDAWSESICVDYSFQDPETRRIEHEVQLEVDSSGCRFRSYQNLVGKRPWR